MVISALGVFDIQSGGIFVQGTGTCTMGGSKIGAGSLTGACGTF